VDFVLENRVGDTTSIELKTSACIDGNAFKGF
jgi:hypothetical protein